MGREFQGIKAALAAIADTATSMGIFIVVIAACVFVAGQAFADDSSYRSAAAAGGFAIGPKLVQEDVRIPARGGRYEIAATILRPEGAGPFGAVILNHGVPGSEKERLAESAAADDVMAAYEYDYARGLPYVDGSRMILAGQSAGGIVSMFAAGMREPKGLVAVLGFAAGRGGNPDIRPGVPCAVEPVAKVFDSLGKTVKVPVLFHYAENDRYFNPATTRLWFDRFTAAGAQADYVMQPAFGKDGHYVFGDLVGVRYWLPAVEKFLAKHAIPFERLDRPVDSEVVWKETSIEVKQAQSKPTSTASMGSR